MTLTRSMPLVCLTLLVAAAASAQGPVPTPPAPPSAPAAPRAPIPPQHGIYADRMQMKQDIDRGMERGGNMGIVPPGTWWKNPDVITALTLTADQQKKMDDIFRQNRIALIDVKASLEKEQINLEPLLNANPVDSTKALAEISKIADLRAGLEKADAKMLLGLRSVLTADQWTKLQDMQHTRRQRPGNPDGEGRGKGAGRGGQPGPGNPPPPPGTN